MAPRMPHETITGWEYPFDKYEERKEPTFLFLDLMFTSWEILGKFLHLLRPQCYLQKGVNTYFAKLLRGSHEIVSGIAPLKNVSQEEVPRSLSQGIWVGLGIPQPKPPQACA